MSRIDDWAGFDVWTEEETQQAQKGLPPNGEQLFSAKWVGYFAPDPERAREGKVSALLENDQGEIWKTMWVHNPEKLADNKQWLTLLFGGELPKGGFADTDFEPCKGRELLATVGRFTAKDGSEVCFVSKPRPAPAAKPSASTATARAATAGLKPDEIPF